MTKNIYIFDIEENRTWIERIERINPEFSEILFR